MTATVHGDFTAWWHDVGSAALVGTARRAAPPVSGLLPSLRLPEGTHSEEALLAAAALGGAALHSGRLPQAGSHLTPVEADEREPAPRRAVQLLELVLTQSPAGAHHAPLLLRHWLRVADERGFRLPHALLTVMLETATAHRDLRAATAAVLDARGHWLAELRPDWAWAARDFGLRATTPTPLSPQEWQRLPSTGRVAALASLRAHEPDLARALIESTWSTDSARDRRAHLETLRLSLAPDDEPLLESALDDRAASVREVAVDLLDALPTSARAQRLADRLRPLVTSKGVLRRHLDVSLPDEPDQAGARDGLGKPPTGRSARGWWLERLAAGAPFEVWTSASGADPATTIQRITDEDALRGIRRAAVARRDTEWAQALLERHWDADLLEALPRPTRENAVLGRLTSAARPVQEQARLLHAVPAPWSAAFSTAVLARLRTAKTPAALVGQTMPQLIAALHPSSLPAVEDWLAHSRQDTSLGNHLRPLLQFHSVKRSISEAFT